MTNKLQVSKKFDDGTIIVVGGDTIEEFSDNYLALVAALEDLGLGIYGNPQASQPECKQSTGETKQFEVENIMLASGGDHPRWVVKGGNFTKFGVTCWPETLEKAGLLKNLNPTADNKPSNKWVAVYTEKPDGKPDKVIEVRPGE